MRRRPSTLIAFAVIVMTSLGGFVGAASVRAEGEAAKQPRLMFGDCELLEDPESAKDALGLLACVKGAVGVEVTSVSGTPDENSWLKYGRLYGGLFVTEWISMQARGRFRLVEPLGDRVRENHDADMEYAAVQVGNPALHPVRLSVGRLPLPFGIDKSSATEHYQSFENRAFWASPRHGAFLTFDNMRSTTLEAGYAYNGLTKEHVKGVAQDDAAGGVLVKEPFIQAASLRIMTDFAALDGSRLLLSGYGESTGARRVGAGFLTVSAKEDLTLFEMVRLLPTPDGYDEDFDQLIRIGYTGSWRNETRWVVQFDDERYHARRGLLGHDARIYGNFVLRLAVSYHKSETGDGQRRWFVTSGMEARL